MALSWKNIAVARTNCGADVFGLAGFLRDDDLICHEGPLGRRYLAAEHIMNMLDVQVMLNPNPDRTSLGSCLGPRRRTAFSVRFRTIDECAAQQDHVVGNLIEDHPMTALGNVPCNGCRACCLHDMIPLLPERGDLIWTYEHEVIHGVSSAVPSRR